MQACSMNAFPLLLMTMFSKLAVGSCLPYMSLSFTVELTLLILMIAVLPALYTALVSPSHSPLSPALHPCSLVSSPSLVSLCAPPCLSPSSTTSLSCEPRCARPSPPTSSTASPPTSTAPLGCSATWRCARQRGWQGTLPQPRRTPGGAHSTRCCRRWEWGHGGMEEWLRLLLLAEEQVEGTAAGGAATVVAVTTATRIWSV